MSRAAITAANQVERLSPDHTPRPIEASVTRRGKGFDTALRLRRRRTLPMLAGMTSHKARQGTVSREGRLGRLR